MVSICASLMFLRRLLMLLLLDRDLKLRRSVHVSLYLLLLLVLQLMLSRHNHFPLPIHGCLKLLSRGLLLVMSIALLLWMHSVTSIVLCPHTQMLGSCLAVVNRTST